MVYISPLAKLSFIMSAVTFLRAQHGLARCGGESENEDGIRVDLTFNSGMRGKTFSVAAGCKIVLELTAGNRIKSKKK